MFGTVVGGVAGVLLGGVSNVLDRCWGCGRSVVQWSIDCFGPMLGVWQECCSMEYRMLWTVVGGVDGVLFSGNSNVWGRCSGCGTNVVCSVETPMFGAVVRGVAGLLFSGDSNAWGSQGKRSFHRLWPVKASNVHQAGES